MRLFGLIGYPLVQSFSKKYFNERFAKQGLTDCRFENFPLSSILEFPGLISGHADLEGLAVTIPYKQKVLPYLDSTLNIPKGLNACNCIRIREGKLEGFNTDHTGFEKSFVPLLQAHHKKALVLGNGGATAAVVYVLKKHNISFDIVSRNIHDGSSYTYQQLDKEIILDHTVIINTTPLGMVPNESTYPAIPYEFLNNHHYLYDLVYNPAETVFLQKGKGRGAIIKNGSDMLTLQAEENWRIWGLD